MVLAIILGVSAWVALIALVGALCAAARDGDAGAAGALEHSPGALSDPVAAHAAARARSLPRQRELVQAALGHQARAQDALAAVRRAS